MAVDAPQAPSLRSRVLLALGLSAAAVALLGLAVALLTLVPADDDSGQTQLLEQGVGGVAEVNLLEHDGRQFYLVRLPDGDLVALSPTEPLRAGRGCTVRPAPEVEALAYPHTVESTAGFLSPCRPARWDLAGRHIGAVPSGPEFNLVRYPIGENADGSLDVDLESPQCTRRPTEFAVNVPAWCQERSSQR
jgi:hypothetical protein